MMRKAIIATVAGVMLAAALAAQDKPNFSGTWKLNLDKSDFGVLPPSNGRTDVVDHQDPQLKINVSDASAQGQQDYTLTMTTDGKEATNTPGGLELKSTAAWAGATLVVNTKLQFQGNDVAIKTIWGLSDDGKTLTESAHMVSPMGETDQKLVFEKQEAGATVVAGAARVASPVAGGAHPNYSGTWKLNVAKSDFGPLPGPETETDIIEHNDPMLKVSSAQDGGPQGKQEFTLNLTTDGKEAVNSPGGMEIRSIGTWEGNNLVVSAKLKFQDNDVAIKTVWILSEDGKILTENAHMTTPMGELDRKMVYEKQ